MPLRFSSPLKVATLSMSTVLVLTLAAIGMNQANFHLEAPHSQAANESVSERSNLHPSANVSSPSSNGVGCSVDLQRCPI